MTIHVNQEEFIKIEEGTIFFRIKFQGQWSERLYPKPKATTRMKILEPSNILSVEGYKFDGEKRVLHGECTRDYSKVVIGNIEITIFATVEDHINARNNRI